MKWIKIFLHIFLFFSFMDRVEAYRPFRTEDAYPSGRNVFEVETGWALIESPSKTRENNFPFSFTYGLTRNLDISLAVPFRSINAKNGNDEEGFGDVTGIVKFVLQEPSEKQFGFALDAIVKTKSGNSTKGLGSGDENISFLGATSKPFSHKNIVHGMLGYSIIGDDKNSGLQNVYFYGTGFDRKINSYLNFILEVNGTKNPERSQSTNMAQCMIGGMLKPSTKSSLVLDGSLRLPLSRAAPDWIFAIGGTFGFY